MIKKLSVCIPTYNRSELLKQTLESVLCQINDEVEIVVCDNASSDDTYKVINEYIKKNTISYYRNKKNMGMDYNFLQCLRNATGEYIQLLSDDDILLPGAINKLLEIIKKYQPSYINLNSYTYNGEYDPTHKKTPRIALKDDLITNNKDVYISKIGVYITYISATCIRKEDFLKLQQPEKYIGSYFLHAHCVFNILNNDSNGTVIITKDAFLAAKNNNSGYFNLYKVWVYEYKKLLLSTAVKNGFSKKLMRKIYIDDINGFIRASILKYRSVNNNYQMNQSYLLLKCTFCYPSVWLKTYKYAFLPQLIVKRIYYRNKNVPIQS